jgi:uncharacterized protein YacL
MFAYLGSLCYIFDATYLTSSKPQRKRVSIMGKLGPLAVIGGIVGVVVGLLVGFFYLAGAIAAALGGGILGWAIGIVGGAILGVFLVEIAFAVLFWGGMLLLLLLGFIISLFSGGR